ncbi:MAG: phage virion morphogenesis protein [Candidatus Kapabacteria bacterium]|nr:phage virion morphogenesis protein [Candidatus Kapabacteria bacterium]
MTDIEQSIRTLIAGLSAEAMQRAMPDIAEVIMTSIADRFDEQSAGTPVYPTGTQAGAWAPLAASTLKRKKGGKILMGGQNAELRKQFSYRIQGDTLFLTNNRTVGEHNLFEIHQYGAKAGRDGKSVIPARPMLALQREDVVEIADIIARSMGR